MNVWGITDPGKVRSQNQDCYYTETLEDGTLLAVVCDGMGGARSGNVASNLACEVFSNEIRRSYGARLTEDEIAAVMDGAVSLANLAVFEHAELSPEFSGMGTTLVAALVKPDVVYFANVGDSRAYCVGEEGIKLVTVDHSVVEMMVRRKEITREQARTHPVKNLITRAVGTADSVIADLFRQPLEAGSYVLLCSDGLSNMMADQEILFEILHGGPEEDCCGRLLQIAADRGAPDNVTAVLVKV